MTQRLRRAIASVGAAGLLILGGCGLPERSTLEAIPDNEIPNELQTPTTTTTTTTTIAPPAPPPTTTPPTTDPASAPIPVDVYLAPPGVDEQMFAFRATIGPPGSLREVVRLLESPPPAARTETLRTAVRRDLIRSYSVDRGTATVELDAQALDFMPDYQERRAIAQIVLTFTGYAPPGEGGIGQIVFVVDGQPIPVIIPGQGSSDPGEGVAFEDFAVLIANADGTPPVTGPATGTTTPTTAPAG